jgi:hypothetical protein
LINYFELVITAALTKYSNFENCIYFKIWLQPSGCNRFISRSCEPTRPHLQKAQMMVAVGHVIQLGHACIRVASGRHLGAGRHLEDHWETRWALGKTQITVLSAPVAHGTTRVGETRQTSTLMGIESNLERSLSKFAHIITCYAQKCCEEP